MFGHPGLYTVDEPLMKILIILMPALKISDYVHKNKILQYCLA